MKSQIRRLHSPTYSSKEVGISMCHELFVSVNILDQRDRYNFVLTVYTSTVAFTHPGLAHSEADVKY